MVDLLPARSASVRRRHDDVPDLRIAAFIVAIDMIAVTYGDLGIFP